MPNSNKMAPHSSISPSFNSISPKPPAPDPNINPFSPLSPDLPENRLRARNADGEVNRLLGLLTMHQQPIIYTRKQLLRIGKRSHQRGPPPGMGPLETWYGPPAGSSSRRGGFGEGFGFGGGIGGSNRGLGGRGGRNIGSHGGQMGRFSVRTPANPTMRLGGEEDRRREDEWRRPDRENGRMPRDTRRPNYQDESVEPAWMDDVAPADPAIVDNTDPLVQFVPGEDMIAAHKRAMKARDVGNDWRGDSGGLPPFFGGGDPAIASSSVPSGPPPGLKPKSFNAADYLKQAQDISDEETAPQKSPHAAPASAFSSRFQKFFSPPTANAAPVVEPRPVDEVKGDRTAMLMGMLSSKPNPPAEHVYHPSPNEQYRHLSSPPAAEGPPSHLSPSFYHSSRSSPPPPAPQANALLQQLYGNTQDRQNAPDPLQLLNQAQRQGYQQRPPHMSMPPQFARPPPDMYMQEDSASDSYNRQLSPTHFPNGPPPPGFMPPAPPAFFQQGPPRPPGYHPVPNYHPAQRAGPPYPPPPLGPAQQDMLATLFAGLGPRN
ncbi:uncharacterized protein I206_106633 [Kwoniella pini CBS 10737]|uniref:Uncharacterized protein n=1 Tax=Kwoniella pini CBS 10737 TaxID=1296096 RepID=A0AAJ8L8I8_9TREE